jgi:IPT/TIG domain-containing protein/calcineurin-like phosphoesterase family protein
VSRFGYSPRLIFILLLAALVGWKPSASSAVRPVTPQQATSANLKVAFIGDQALGPNAVAVLNLIKSEGAQAVLHSGDLDYIDDPSAWEAQINGVLGPDFPYFVTIGNHDEVAWRGLNGYQQRLVDRFNRLGITWSGDLGVQSAFHFRGLFFVMTAPGIGSGFDAGDSDTYIRNQLSADNSIWSICTWHKDMRLMQVGGKTDETGWGVYEEARKGGAIIATAHEHSYSRTHLLSSMMNQTIASTSNTLTLTKGNSFAFVSGLGGNSVRPQLLDGPWWASISASTCLAGDPVCQPNGNFGALFGIFNVDGQPNKALFYFKDISGRVVETFTVISNVELPSISSLSPANTEAGRNSFTLAVNGENFGNNAVVRWNNVDKPTTFVSSTQLSATISSADIAAAGAALVTVAGPGGTSNGNTFTITRPIPNITSLQPASVEAGGSSFTLNVYGINFGDGSVVRWNGVNRATTLISSTQLAAAVLPADFASPGTAYITVSNADGTSNASSFTILPPSLILLTEDGSDHAIVLDSVTMVRDPFLFYGPNYLSSDSAKRIMLFSPNLSLMPSDSFSSVTVQAEDSQQQSYPLTVEFVGTVPQHEWLTQIVVRLPEEVTTAQALRVNLSYRGAVSNKAMISVK